MSKEYIHTDNAPSAIGAYSQAIKLDGIVYCSGQIPLDPKEMVLVSDNIDEHMEKRFKKPFPARAAIGIKELPKGALIEIDAIAEAK